MSVNYLSILWRKKNMHKKLKIWKLLFLLFKVESSSIWLYFSFLLRYKCYNNNGFSTSKIFISLILYFTNVCTHYYIIVILAVTNWDELVYFKVRFFLNGLFSFFCNGQVGWWWLWVGGWLVCRVELSCVYIFYRFFSRLPPN